jgi:hypothetical protein
VYYRGNTVTELKLRRGRPPADRNEVTSELLATGEASMAQLAHLFQTDAKTLPRRLRGLKPSGQRHNTKTYLIREAASRIVKPGYAIEQYLRTMNHSELPPLLTKEYWNGQRARQIYEENAGDLWRTADVVEGFAEAFKTLRMSLLLMADAVDRESELSEPQRKALKRMIDGSIDDLREKMVSRFKDYAPSTALIAPASVPDDSGLEPGDSGVEAASAEDYPEDPDDL